VGFLRRRLFRGPVETGLVTGVLYLLVTAGAATVEWWRDRDDILNGAFAMEGQPFGFSRALAWPIHGPLADAWPGWPEQFDTDVYRSLLDHAWRQTVGAALLEACLIALIVASLGMVFRSLRRGG
jgi:hypothetical protein